MSVKGSVGSFLTTKLAARSVRQRHATGPQFYKRKFFRTTKGHHQLHRRVGGFVGGNTLTQPEHTQFAHLPGDVRRRPQNDFTYDERVDKARFSWKKRGNLQVYQMGGKAETFVCFRCGYPVRSNLQVIKSDNWDWKMCYPCYLQVVRQGMQKDI
mmetsp:Transcript_37114/g.43334  ORF Transcript_37114/g.43334 Transcript_37114/m.43334 type:complete len:155 (-) Transcript_37114:27-491(-)